jgi:hypothetical protein
MFTRPVTHTITLDESPRTNGRQFAASTGCPNVFNEEASYEQYLEMYKYGNHKSVEQNLEKVMKP